MPRPKNGPGAFCISVGIVIAFAGLLTLLAYPAAIRMDVKEALQDEKPVGHVRRNGIVRAGALQIVLGGAVIATGLVLLSRSKRH